jgi:poly-gamma-glutamate capsule biosynthesis protein CapA/YwtB (metallophosphatase superfamily)
VRPDVRVINLETSVTSCDQFWPGKGIHYRMHPENIGCLTAARVDICTLANNHVLDYSYGGLEETLDTLMAAGIKVTGAGRNLETACRPAMVDLADARRILVFSIGFESSGIPSTWAADMDRPGVDWLPDLSDKTADTFLERVRRIKRTGDIAVASIHWGSNWGYDIPPSQIRFAHRLLEGEVDLVHGHSSHHPRPIEIYQDKLVLYGCGDFLNDYEGISGYEQFRDDLVLMYFPRIDPATGRLLTLSMAPMRIRQMRLAHASAGETEWLRDRLALICQTFGSDIDLTGDGKLMLHRLVAPRA